VPSFSAILDTPQFRALVQQGALDKTFQVALFPELLWRSEAEFDKWEANAGDEKIFTGKGLMEVKTAPLAPGVDPTPAGYDTEQWKAVCVQYANSIDTHLPTAYMAAVNKLFEDIAQLGLNAGQTINRLVRDRMYNAGLSGQTVIDGTQGSSTTIRVKRLNGFTRARRPDLAAGSQVRYDPVTTANPLPVTFYLVGVATARNVTGFTPDFAGDEIGPGTITVDVAIAPNDREPLIASNASYIVRSGGGRRVDDVGAADRIALIDIRSAVARLRNMNVPKHGDGFFHAHVDPTANAQFFADNEVQRLNIGVPDGIMYKEMAIGRMLGCVFFENNECPQTINVNLLSGKTDGTVDNYDPTKESFAGELYNLGDPATSAALVHRTIVTGGAWLREYWVDQGGFSTDAGYNGTAEQGASIDNGEVTVKVDRVWMFMRRPQNRLQNQVANTWSFLGDWVPRTDGATGDAAMYKRAVIIESGESTV
jgi:hypothetical protein